MHHFASLTIQATLNLEVFLLIRLKKERTHKEDRRLALWLATSAGLLNAIALGAFGFFPSHMTGNTSQLSSEVSSTDLSDMFFRVDYSLLCRRRHYCPHDRDMGHYP